ncbi:ABC transporter permease [Sulfurifustis variabilis]|uniref:ABC transporter permease n=1 Tax=Sulfurifustis variabilis TaxID=1675686 RepID=A0A1B4V1C4_9GAMM|nr:ABC transporter permease subunit [Sulfurifustis variabilis]BAU47075.1 ABC transporter permease [Sulfurifustis variabilis]
MIFTIAVRELKNLFVSPLAWAILAVVQAILAWFFLALLQLEQINRAKYLAMENAPGITQQIVPELLYVAAFLLLLIVPLLTMRVVAEERRNQTLPLLFSAPVSMTEIVLGKYLGVLLFLLILVTMIALMPLSLLYGTALDLGLLASGLLGLVLVVASFAAVGVFTSTITRHPIVAAIAGFGMLLLFWVLDATGQGDPEANLFAYLSIFNHYQPFLFGVFDSADAAYHLLLITTFLVLSIKRLDAARLGG